MEKLLAVSGKTVDPSPPALSPEDAELAAWASALPCLHCAKPEGATIRHLHSQAQLSLRQRTPSGGHLDCCRVGQVIKGDPAKMAWENRPDPGLTPTPH
jgi:hypothetical protein